MNTPKTLDNRAAQAFVSDYLHAGELCEAYPAADDIFSGVLALSTAGNTATRSLSRKTLFHIIRWCPEISAAAVDKATGGRYAPRTVQGYAALARVLSLALAGLADRVHGQARGPTITQEREQVDAPFKQAAESLPDIPAKRDPQGFDPLRQERTCIEPARVDRMRELAELVD